MKKAIKTHRISICGSVDDGKSTLLGRLIYNMGNYTQDKLEEVERISSRNGKMDLDYSLFTDGLMAEREQGITIDVAHLYMTFDNKRIIWADAPGHEQYTRNMITAASTSNASLLLSDVARPITKQFLRHLDVIQMLDIPNVLIVINKMDLVDFDGAIYEARKAEIEHHLSPDYSGAVEFIPVSAVTGYNVTKTASDGFSDRSVLDWIQSLEEKDEDNATFAQIQSVVHRGQNNREYHIKTHAGEIVTGKKLYTVNGQECTVKQVFTLDGKNEGIKKGDCATIRVAEDIDLSRGTDLVSKEALQSSKQIPVRLFNLGWNKPIKNKKKYILQRGVRQVKAMVELQDNEAGVGNNEFAAAQIRLSEDIPLLSDSSAMSRSFILIDEIDNSTCAAGLIDS